MAGDKFRGPHTVQSIAMNWSPSHFLPRRSLSASTATATPLLLPLLHTINLEEDMTVVNQKPTHQAGHILIPGGPIQLNIRVHRPIHVGKGMTKISGNIGIYFSTGNQQPKIQTSLGLWTWSWHQYSTIKSLQGCSQRWAPGCVKMSLRSCVLLPAEGKQNTTTLSTQFHTTWCPPLRASRYFWFIEGPKILMLNCHPLRQPPGPCTGNSIRLSSASKKIHKREEEDKEVGGEEDDTVVAAAAAGDVIRSREFVLLGRFLVRFWP